MGRARTAAGGLGAAPNPSCRGGGSGAPCTEGLGLMRGGDLLEQTPYFHHPTALPGLEQADQLGSQLGF